MSEKVEEEQKRHQMESQKEMANEDDICSKLRRKEQEREEEEAERRCLEGHNDDARVYLLEGGSADGVFPNCQVLTEQWSIGDDKGKIHEDGTKTSKEKKRDSKGCLLKEVSGGGQFQSSSVFPEQWSVGDDVVIMFESCLEEVERLQLRRDVLVQDLLALEHPLQAQLQDLRLQLTHTRSRLSHTELQKHKLQQEVMHVKRKLFTVMRECMQNQITLAAQKYEVEQFTFVQEELQDDILQRLQELAQMRENQQSRLLLVRKQLLGQNRPRTMSDLTHCRRVSADFSQYTRASIQNLEQWYEPKLLVLLRRKQASEDSLRKSKELGCDLKKYLEPLREENRKMELQREQLQQKINLMEEERSKRASQYRECACSLEECVRKLKTDLQIQLNTNSQLTEINNYLTAQTSVYRRCLGFSDGLETADEGTETISDV
ncbi:syncoilin-like [Hoplias malabaricus]|uniref:syncoilin-like n=1 Tax=Hoplias malabaricus TaxID=27720 RepID=UPI0034625FB6